MKAKPALKMSHRAPIFYGGICNQLLHLLPVWRRK